MSAEDEVRQASDQYYAALSHLLSGDAGPIMQVWSHSPDVTAMNPYGGIEVGWERLQAVFERVAQVCIGSHITLKITDSLIRASADLAYEIGIESGEGTLAGQPASIRHRVTNIYRREAGEWKNIHRHTDLNPAEKDAGHTP
jgi:ketosteroid isomerase-like protein